MNPLFSPEEFELARSKQLLPLVCKECGEIFYRAKKVLRFRSSLHPERNATFDFCSRACSSKSRFNQLEVNCLQCGRSFFKLPAEIKKTPNNFCSQSCAATYHNQHKTRGFRRSKLEAWLEKQLTALYPQLEFHFNRTDAIEAELDIFIPSLKLAFELNGIFHYEPIYGADKLARVHANDHRKIIACYEQGIELCIVDNSTMKHFTEKRAQTFLDIIRRVVDRRLNQ